MHYQAAPHTEVKIVSCVAGAIYDVIVDLRPASANYRGWQGFELSAENGRQLYVPAGFAQGFRTLTDGAELWRGSRLERQRSQRQTQSASSS